MIRLRSLVIASLTLAVGVTADVRPGMPAAQVRLQIEGVVKVLTDPGLKVPGREQERQASVRKIAEETFDLGEMRRRTLGPHWRERTEAERAEFITLFGDLLNRVCFTKIAPTTAKTLASGSSSGR